MQNAQIGYIQIGRDTCRINVGTGSPRPLCQSIKHGKQQKPAIEMIYEIRSIFGI